MNYRAWDKNLKEMIPVNNIDFKSNQINTRGLWRIIGIDVILMQSTDVYDINNKEASLSDVVKTEYGVGKVVFQGGCFTIEWDGDVYNEPLFGNDFRKRD